MAREGRHAIEARHPRNFGGDAGQRIMKGLAGWMAQGKRMRFEYSTSNGRVKGDFALKGGKLVGKWRDHMGIDPTPHASTRAGLRS